MRFIALGQKVGPRAPLRVMYRSHAYYLVSVRMYFCAVHVFTAAHETLLHLSICSYSSLEIFHFVSSLASPSVFVAISDAA